MIVWPYKYRNDKKNKSNSNGNNNQINNGIEKV